MENPSQKCEICAEAGPNQTMLPRHYIRRKFKAQTLLDLSGEDLCDKCLFEIERDVYSVKELIERWTITDANMINVLNQQISTTVPGSTYVMCVM